MTFIVLFILGGFFNAVRGGQHARLRRAIERRAGIAHDETGQVTGRLCPHQRLIHRALDGKAINATAFGLAAALLPAMAYTGMAEGLPRYEFVDPAWTAGVFAGLAMLAGTAPGWGDYIGAIGGWREKDLSEWPPIDALIERWRDEPEAWGFFGLTLRGGLWGFLLALALHSLAPVFAGLMMGFIYAVCLHYFGRRGWPVAEWVFGGILWLACLA